VLDQYTTAMNACSATDDKCQARAANALTNIGLTSDQIAQIPQQYVINTKIQENYTKVYTPALNSYLACKPKATDDCSGSKLGAVTGL